MINLRNNKTHYIKEGVSYVWVLYEVSPECSDDMVSDGEMWWPGTRRGGWDETRALCPHSDEEGGLWHTGSATVHYHFTLTIPTQHSPAQRGQHQPTMNNSTKLISEISTTWADTGNTSQPSSTIWTLLTENKINNDREKYRPNQLILKIQVNYCMM